MRSTSMRARLRRARSGALTLLLASLLLAGCTGSVSTRTPIVLFLAGDDGGASTLRAFSTNLPFDAASGAAALSELPTLRQDLGTDTEIVDVATVTATNPALYVLLRDATVPPADRLLRFDLDGLDVNAAAGPSLPAPVSLATALSVASDAVGEALCTGGLSVSPDGRWIGLLHVPSACGGTAPPAVVVVEALADGADSPVVGPPLPGTSDVAAVPTFLGVGEATRTVWLDTTRDEEVVVWSPDAPSAPKSRFGIWPRSTGSAAIGRSGTGVAVTDGRDVVFLAGEGAAAGPAWPIDDVGSLVGVVDADVLPGLATFVLGTNGVVGIRDLNDDPNGVDSSGGSAFLAAVRPTATLGPYGYLFVAETGTLSAYDALRFASGEALQRAAVTSLGSFAPSAAAWSFGASATP